MLRKRLASLTLIAGAIVLMPAVAHAGSCFWDCHGAAMLVMEYIDFETASAFFVDCMNLICGGM